MLDALFFWLRNGEQVQMLARDAEALARKLNALPVTPADPQRNIVMTLQSTCALLQQFINERETARPEESMITSSVEQDQSVPAQQEPTVVAASPAVAVPSAAAQEEPAVVVAAPAVSELSATTQEEPVTAAPAPIPSTLSATARDLMKLSDLVLLAKSGGNAVQPEVLAEIYRQLTKALAKEGVMLLDASGPCDYECQMVVGTHSTNDATQNDHIYSTVRPGYLFHEQIIRPQEVIIYTHFV